MKKSLLLLPAMMVALASNAQITITQSDFVTVGATVKTGNDTAVTQIIGSGGAGKTWNYSSLTADNKDTIDFVPPSMTPYAADFPGSNLAGYSHGSNGEFLLYLNKSASSLQLEGYASQGTIINPNPNEILTPFPATYGTNFTNTYSYKTDFPFTGFPGYDSLRIVNHTSKTANYDAYGSLTLTMGTYNTIRLMETIRTVDSVFIHSTGPFPPAGWSVAQVTPDSSYRYSWFANSLGYTMLQMDSASTGEKTATFLLVNPNSVQAIAQAKESSVYPNPASGIMNFSYEGSSNDLLVIYDLAGNVVRKEAIMKGNNRVDVTELSAGMYIYHVAGNDGNITSSGKFSVAK